MGVVLKVQPEDPFLFTVHTQTGSTSNGNFTSCKFLRARTLQVSSVRTSTSQMMRGRFTFRRTCRASLFSLDEMRWHKVTQPLAHPVTGFLAYMQGFHSM